MTDRLCVSAAVSLAAAAGGDDWNTRWCCSAQLCSVLLTAVICACTQLRPASLISRHVANSAPTQLRIGRVTPTRTHAVRPGFETDRLRGHVFRYTVTSPTTRLRVTVGTTSAIDRYAYCIDELHRGECSSVYGDLLELDAKTTTIKFCQWSWTRWRWSWR